MPQQHLKPVTSPPAPPPRQSGQELPALLTSPPSSITELYQAALSPATPMVCGAAQRKGRSVDLLSERLSLTHGCSELEAGGDSPGTPAARSRLPSSDDTFTVLRAMGPSAHPFAFPAAPSSAVASSGEGTPRARVSSPALPAFSQPRGVRPLECASAESGVVRRSRFVSCVDPHAGAAGTPPAPPGGHRPTDSFTRRRGSLLPPPATAPASGALESFRPPTWAPVRSARSLCSNLGGSSCADSSSDSDSDSGSDDGDAETNQKAHTITNTSSSSRTSSLCEIGGSLLLSFGGGGRF